MQQRTSASDAGVPAHQDASEHPARRVDEQPQRADLLRHEALPILHQIRTEAQALAIGGRRGDVAERVSFIDDLARQAEESITAVARLLTVEARPNTLDLTTLDLSDVIIALLARWKTRAPSHSFELALPGEVPLITADARMAEMALDALLEEAVALNGPEGIIRVIIRPGVDAVEVSVQPFTHVANASVLIEKRPGQAEAKARVALAAVIVARHGGRVWEERGILGRSTALHASWPFVAEPPEQTLDAPITSAENTDLKMDAVVASALPRGGSLRQTALLWEPNARIARYLRSNLEARQMRMAMAAKLEEVPKLIELEEPDLILLDVTTEEQISAILAKVTRLTDAPVLLLASQYDAEICARLLDRGAADYIAKPLHIDELVARVRVALRARRRDEETASRETTFQSGELSIDFGQRRVLVGEREIALSKTEYKLLRTLAEHAGKVLSHDWLLEHVWGAEYTRETEFIWVYVRRLRRKIEPDPKRPRYVLTAPGVGYRLAKS